ncbi:MAG: cysteine synthase family protein [Chloroflexi bacterium]|nr:cysteine synthase family protein [Chloroflexota bacterium]
MARYSTLIEAIGHTPLVELRSFSPRPGVRLFAKLEGHNPTGSVKDRIARSLIEDAERSGAIGPHSILLEPTSGNTGIALAMICRIKGYRLKVVMPDNVSVERRQLLEIFGAEIELTDGALGSNGSIRRAQELAAEPAYHLLYQYGNAANPRAHYETTGPEIVADLPDVDVFVAGLGTGGTLMGTGRRLKEHNPNVQIVAAEPHPEDQVQGLRSLDHGFIPPILDLARLDRKVVVRSDDALEMTRELTHREGIFAGLSSGAVLHVGLRVASRMEHGNIVLLFADGGWKYLSTGIWTGAAETAAEGIRGRVMW